MNGTKRHRARAYSVDGDIHPARGQRPARSRLELFQPIGRHIDGRRGVLHAGTIKSASELVHLPSSVSYIAVLERSSFREPYTPTGGVNSLPYSCANRLWSGPLQVFEIVVIITGGMIDTD